MAMNGQNDEKRSLGASDSPPGLVELLAKFTIKESQPILRL